MSAMSRDGRAWLPMPALLMVALGVVGPVAILLGYSFGLTGDDAVPGLAHYAATLSDSFYLGVYWDTLRMAAVMTAVSLLAGYPLALIIARASGRTRTVLIAAVVTPLLTNIVVRTLGWVLILSNQGLLNSLLGWLSPGLQVNTLGSITGITIGLTHVGIPLMVLSLLTSMDDEDPSLREAAQASGAHPWTTFIRVTLPLSAPGIVAGTTLVFVLGVAALITPLLLGRGRTFVLSTLMVQEIGILRWGRAAALALVLFLIVFVAVGVLQRIALWFGTAQTKENRAALPRRPLGSVIDRLNHAPVVPRLSTFVRRAYLTVVVAFLLIPLAVVFKSAFDTRPTMHAGFDGFTFRWIADALDPNLFLPSILLSLRLAAMVVLLGLLLAIPAALAIVRGNFRGRQAILSFLLSPLLLPHSALAIGFVLFFQIAGVGPSIWRLLLAHMMVAFPYMVRVLVSALTGTDPALGEAAAGLGATPLTVIRRVILPSIRAGIFAAVLFGALMSFDEATISVLVAGSSTATLPVKIFSELSTQFTPAVAAISTLLIAFVVLVIVPLERRLGILTSSRVDARG